MSHDWAAVIGWPVEHSLSPTLFKYLSAKMNRLLDYSALPIEPSDLRSKVKAAKTGQWVGWNVTIPHKVNIMPLMHKLDDSARLVGAVNVVHFQEGGAIGYNTDAEGFIAPLERGGAALKTLHAVVFGAGGAARAVCSALRKNNVGEIRIIGRSAENVSRLVKDFGAHSGSTDFGNTNESVMQADLVVNATPLGMDGKTSPLGPGARWKNGALAYDLVYRPLETPFLRQAREGGARTLGGLAMLVAQAAATWRIWFKEEIPGDVCEYVEAELRRTFA